jgi:hypothetical protein
MSLSDAPFVLAPKETWGAQESAGAGPNSSGWWSGLPPAQPTLAIAKFVESCATYGARSTSTLESYLHQGSIGSTP